MSDNSIVAEMLKKMREARTQQSQGALPSNDLKIDSPKNEAYAFWDPNNASYWMKNYDGDWQKEAETHLKRYLECRVFAGVDSKHLQKRMIDMYLLELHYRMNVHYAGPLAGYRRGVATVCGNKVLVTREAESLKPKSGDWSSLRALVEEMLRDQAKYLYGWMQSALRAMRAGPPFRPGQALAMCGPSGSGKSLLQNLFTEVLGGRACKPYKFMRGKTDFNSEHLGTEHLMIEDEAAATDLKTRREIGAAIKSFVANETHTMFKKSKEPIMLSPFWRVTITLNDEPENLMVLPPLDESMRDKIFVLKAYPTTCQYDAGSEDSRRKWREKLSSELPAFMSYVMTYKIPAAEKDVRYGIKAYQHPDVMEALAELSPELRLLTLIDLLMEWDNYRNPWVGTAALLEDLLLTRDKVGRVARVLTHNAACGGYLSRLANGKSGRVEVSSRRSGKVVWVIHPPKDDPIPE